jgi:predicted ATP-dependent serine protease
VVYYSAEEKLGPTFAARLERCGVKRDDFYAIGQASVDDLCEFCIARHAVALVVDSIQMTTIRPEDLRRLLEAARAATLVYVLHATKAGEPAGANSYLHEADVVIRVAELRWTVTKSRYQEADGVAREVLRQ